MLQGVIVEALIGFYPNVITSRSRICGRNSVCLSVICRLRAPYSSVLSFRQCFYVFLYGGHRLTAIQNFTEIVSGKPLRRR